MSKPETTSLYEFFQQFPNEETARLFFEKNRWKGETSCPHCGSAGVVECKDHNPMPYRCRDCRKHFSVRTGTVLAESRLPLQKWLMAIYMMTTARKGIPSTQMARELGITQKSAWFLAQRIRETWLSSFDGGLGGVVEVDETYIGGKEKNKHADKKLHAGRGAVGKQAVVGVLQRGGRVVALPVSSTDRETLHGFINANVQKGATVYTDDHRSYLNMEGYTHESVCHSVGEYVREQAHTNGVESFWALLKRGYHGIYHHMSAKHLHRYVNEFSFRHDTAKTGTMAFIEMTIGRMLDRRLTYKELIHVPLPKDKIIEPIPAKFEEVAKAIIADGKPITSITGKMEQIPLPLIEHRIEASSVTIDQRANDGYVNATAICQASGKKINDYTRLATTQAFIQELENETGIPAATLIQSISGGNPRLQGTWVHPQVAIHLGQWASPKFAVLVSKWVFEWMSGGIKEAYRFPYHIRRYLVNRSKIPSTHFSMLDQMTFKLLGALEAKGYIIPAHLMPDISLGRIFSGWLREKGYNPDSFPTYDHDFDDGRRPVVGARLYPNELMTEFNQQLDTWITSGRALEYFSDRDANAIEPMKAVYAELAAPEQTKLLSKK